MYIRQDTAAEGLLLLLLFLTTAAANVFSAPVRRLMLMNDTKTALHMQALMNLYTKQTTELNHSTQATAALTLFVEG